MKKFLTGLCACLLLAGCGSNDTPTTSQPTTGEESQVLKVSATLDPHAKILEFVKPILKEDYNIDLEITVLDDYYIFNKALDAKEVDANYFQHEVFFDNEVESNGYNIVNAGGIHIEPFGFYSKKIKSIDELADGATIVISNSYSDHGRILKILADEGLITLKEGVNVVDATVEDIVDNPKNLQFVEVKPELLSVTYDNDEGDLVAINGNYAMQAGLNPSQDALILEKADSSNPYVNIVATHADLKDDARINALVEVLKSDAVKEFIASTYQGSVIVAE